MTTDTELLPINQATYGSTHYGHGWSSSAHTNSKGSNPENETLHEKEDATEEEAQEKPKSLVSKLSSRQKATVALGFLATFLACLGYALLAPFFPAEANAKGMSQTLIGLLFGSFSFCLFLGVTVCGSFMSCIGPKFAFIAGQVLGGGTTVLFGLLYLSPPGAPFIALCFALRVVSALALGAYIAANFVLMASELPDVIAMAMGALEACSGIGLALGPSIGGAMYEIGGFGLPFYVLGALLLVTAIVSHFVVIEPGGQKSPQESATSKEGSMLISLLKSPQVLVACFANLSVMYSVGFIEGSIAAHLQQFHLSILLTGFALNGMTVPYTFLSIGIGWLSYRTGIINPFIITGVIVAAIGQLFVGPTPLFHIPHAELWLVLVSLVAIGCGVGLTVTPSLNCIYAGSRVFLGPTIGSLVMDAVGFEWSATLASALCLCAAAAMAVLVIADKMCTESDSTKATSAGKTEETQLEELCKGLWHKSDVSYTKLNG